jgi:starch synthase
MPSKFEPCGLNQMYSLRYGTVPVVHATGGLADTVENYDGRRSVGNGFVFQDYTPYALMTALRRSVKYFADRQRWESLMKIGMRQDFSWAKSAAAYLKLYRAIARS